MFRKLLILPILATALFFASCKKSDSAGPQTVSLVFHNVVNDTHIVANTYYAIAPDTFVKFSTLKYWISNVKLLKAGGEEVSLPNTYFKADALANTDEVGHVFLDLTNVPLGTYTGIKYTVGLDSATNHTANWLSTSANPVLNAPDMHWNWNPNAGYIFFKAEGKVKIGGTETDITYHLGTDASRNDISIAVPFTLDGSAKSVGIDANLAELFANVNLPTETFMMSSPASNALGAKLKTNIGSRVYAISAD
jgi:hypothetical protein